MNSIVTDKLTKKYGEITAVDNLSLEVRRGELFSLLGVNGAGKTTAIKMLTCLSRPTSGDARLNGKSILDNTAEVKKIIAVSPQETAVAPALTVLENLELICGVFGLDKKKREEKIKELSDKLSLSEVLSRKAGKLSGGWQRRLSIAMALISEPEILFLDEPTLGLDVIARSELWDIIRSLKGRVTIILTTHYMEEAEALSDRVAIMSRGRLLISDTAENIKKAGKAESFEEAFINIVKEAGK